MDMMKNFKMQDCKPVSTPMTTSEKLSKDDDSEKIDEGLYRSLIGSLLYLTASRPEYCLLLVCFPGSCTHQVRNIFRQLKEY